MKVIIDHINSRQVKYMLLLLVIVSTFTHSTLAQVETSNTSALKCPPPLITKLNGLNGLDDDNQVCFDECCLACPFTNNFYEKNKIEKTFESFAIVGIVSFFLMILLGIFFVKLPSQRQNPLAKQILLPLALSVAYFEGSEFFTINQQQSQCFDSITSAVPSNNAYCAAQAIFTLGGGYVISSYSALLIIHLHLISVWRTEFITKNIYYFHFLIIGGSVAAIVVPFATNNVQSSNICFISLDGATSYFYFLSFIYIAFAAHLATIIYMAHITVKSSTNITSTMSKHTSIIEAQRKLNYLKAIFKIQWRALLGALLMLAVYVLNWHYYVFTLPLLVNSITPTSWMNWIGCLRLYDQDTCAREISNTIPNYNYIFILLFFNRTAGILIFIIFAAKKVVLLELFDIMRGKKLKHLNPRLSLFETDSIRFSFHSIRGSIMRKANKRVSIIGNTALAGSSNRESETSKEVKNSIEVPQPVKFASRSLPRIDPNFNTISSLRGPGDSSSPNGNTYEIVIKDENSSQDDASEYVSSEYYTNEYVGSEYIDSEYVASEYIDSEYYTSEYEK